jgi:hypothetical protein
MKAPFWRKEMIRLKRLAFVFALIAVMCITAAPVRADTANIPVAISTDYSFLVAGLGPVVPGSPYQWTVDGVVAMEGAAEETFSWQPIEICSRPVGRNHHPKRAFPT